jgi:hypothetical protein
VDASSLHGAGALAALHGGKMKNEIRRGTHTAKTTVGVARSLMKWTLFATTCAAMAYNIQAYAGELINVPTRSDVTEGIFIDQPSTSPSWVVVLFAGNDGAVDITGDGPRMLRGNFLVRTASYWPAAGDAAVIFDAPSDHHNGMDDVFRLSAEAVQDVEAVVATLRHRYPSAKIALVGTSRGTITVGNVVKREPALADAYVLTSPVTLASRGQAGLSGMSWEGNKARVLVISNEGDGCRVSPFEAAEHMAHANGFDFVAVSSSESNGPRAECNGDSPHGYLGIESQVLDTIRNWLAGSAVTPAASGASSVIGN